MVLRVRKSVTSPGDDGSRVEADLLLDFGAVFPGHDEPVGVRVRQRLEQDAVDEAENRGVAADPERERQDRYRGEAWPAGKSPDGRADVLHKRSGTWGGVGRPVRAGWRRSVAAPSKAGGTAAGPLKYIVL